MELTERFEFNCKSNSVRSSPWLVFFSISILRTSLSMPNSLLECGTQLTGGYFAHPCGKNISLRDLEKLFHLSCPFADIDKDGNLVFGKLLNTGGFVSVKTILSLFKIFECLFFSTLWKLSLLKCYTHILSLSF